MVAVALGQAPAATVLAKVPALTAAHATWGHPPAVNLCPDRSTLHATCGHPPAVNPCPDRSTCHLRSPTRGQPLP